MKTSEKTIIKSAVTILNGIGMILKSLIDNESNNMKNEIRYEK